MEVIARHNVLCLDEASLPRRLLTRGALLAFLAGALSLVGLILSQPAHAAVTDAPGTTMGTVTGAAGAVTGAAASAASTASQAGTAATQAVGQAASQAPGLATSAATHTAGAASSAAAASQGTGAAGQAVNTAGQAVGAASPAAGAATQAVSGVVSAATGIIPGGTASGGGTEPPHKHHRGRAPHRHRHGHPRHRHGTPGGHPGRSGRPIPGSAGRLAPFATTRHLLPGDTEAHGIAGMSEGRTHPASPAPVLPAIPVPPAAGSLSGSGIEAQPGHAAAGLPALTAAAAGAAARIPARHSDAWTALLRDRRGPHRPG